MAEYFPDRQRGFLGSFLEFSSISGFMLMVLLENIMGSAHFLSWGWRIFFLAAPLGLLGLYLRHAAEETPVFQQQGEMMKVDQEQGDNRPQVSFQQIVVRFWRVLLVSIGLVLTTNVTHAIPKESILYSPDIEPSASTSVATYNSGSLTLLFIKFFIGN